MLDDKKNFDAQKRSAVKAGYAAVIIVSILILTKACAYYASGSASILSSLMDSLLDSVISVTALGSIYYAQRPADEDHRWGHGKMEAVSALFQAAFIIGGGAFLVFESMNRIFNPIEVKAHELGAIVMIVSIGLSAMLVLIQRRALESVNSLAVEADSAHYGSDIIVNIGVLVILSLSKAGAPTWIDPAFALCVAGVMGYTARSIARKSIDMLMDRELPEEERSRIINIIKSHQGVLDLHDLRTHRHGVGVVISFDIEVDAQLSLRSAHAIAKEVEFSILNFYPNAEILIHVDPDGEPHDSRHKVKGVHH